MALAVEISTQSPFLPPAGQAVAIPVTENAPIELRGIMATGGKYIYGLFDPSRQKATWVKENETGHDFVVKSHDVANSAVVVEYQGRTLNLALKVPKIDGAPMVQAPVAGPQAPRSPQAAMIRATPADEAKRLETVAAEVRRRRALRQAAAAGQRPGMPPPPSGAAPVVRPAPPGSTPAPVGR